MLTVESLSALGIALGALIVVAVLTALVPRLRSLPILVPLAAGYLLGQDRLDLLDGELSRRALILALGISAGWIALDASSAALATLKRSRTRNAAYWAVAYALLAPSILAAGMSPIAVSIMGAGGLALHGIAVAGAAGALPDPSVFKSALLRDKVSADKLRVAVRTSDALFAASLAALPMYWGVARSIAQGEGMLADAVIASVAACYALGLALGLAMFFLIRYLKWSLAVAAVLLLITIAAAALGEAFQVSAVATCFIAGSTVGQDELRRKDFLAVVHNLKAPFFLVMLVAAGAAAPAWKGVVGPLLVVVLILGGRFVIGKIADTLAATSLTVGSGRHFAWLAALPSALSVAVVAEAVLLLGNLVEADPQGALGTGPALAVSLAAPFLLAVGLADIFGRNILARGYPRAIAKAKAAPHSTDAKHHHARGHKRTRS